MILSSLKLARFRGLADLEVRDLPIQGLVCVALPSGAEPALLEQALRYVVSGEEPPGGALEPGGGYCFVEGAFVSPGGTHFSLFRGVGRGGGEQVSLREEDGPLLRSGTEAVNERLVELLGRPIDRWLAVSIPDASRVRLTSEPEPAPPPSRSPVRPAAPADTGRLEAARARVTDAADGLLRSFHAEFLLERAVVQLAGLAALGGRLRSERATAAMELGRLSAERERVRSRLRRLAEYRELTTRTGPVVPATGPAAKGPSSIVLSSLALLTGAFFVMLIWLLAGREPGLEGLELKLAVSAGLLLCLASFLMTATRRRAAAAGGPVAGTASEYARTEWREALQTRFRDLENPDDPQLPERLRGGLAALESDLAPSQARLERLDEAIALYEVEVGRACRALHRPLPEALEAAGGFLPDEGLEGIDQALSSLGDGIFQACSERDALAAGGAPPIAVAKAEARAAVAALVALLGGDSEDAGADAVLPWDALESPVDEPVLATVRRTCEVLGQLARAENGAAGDVDESAVPADVHAAVATEPIGRRFGAALLDPDDDALALVAEQRLPGALALLSDDQWSAARIDDRGRLELSGPMGTVSLGALPAPIRARLGIGLLLLAEADTTGMTGGLRLFSELPSGFTGAEDLARYLHRVLPGPVQVLLPAGADQPASAASDPSVVSGSLEPGRNGRPSAAGRANPSRLAGRVEATEEEQEDATR